MPLDPSRVKAVYFDLDDTLCTYWDAAKGALVDVHASHLADHCDFETFRSHWATNFRTFCFSIKKTEWYSRYLKSGEPSRTELMRLTLASVGLEHVIDARELGDAYAAFRDKRLALFDHALECLTFFGGSYGIGLITNGPADVQRSEIATLGIGALAGHVLIEGELGFGKPNAEVFQTAESQGSWSADQMLFVGNSYFHDILPAIEAGWQTVWVRRPSDVAPSADPADAKPEERPADKPEPSLEISELVQLLNRFNN